MFWILGEIRNIAEGLVAKPVSLQFDGNNDDWLFHTKHVEGCAGRKSGDEMPSPF